MLLLTSCLYFADKMTVVCKFSVDPNREIFAAARVEKRNYFDQNRGIPENYSNSYLVLFLYVCVCVFTHIMYVHIKLEARKML